MSVLFHSGNFVFLFFRPFGCVIFFTMVSVCKARQARLLRNVNKHFHNFIGQNQQKTKSENGMKSSLVPKIVHDISIPEQ